MKSDVVSADRVSISPEDKSGLSHSQEMTGRLVTPSVRRAISLSVSARKEKSFSAATITYSPSAPSHYLRTYTKKTSSGSPELKKPCSLPPPTTRPPPPVEQRSSAFQRPLPPTPEGKKFQLPSPDKSHSTTTHQTTPVSFRQMPWFHNIDRHRAEELLRNGEDGFFVVRPSTQTSNPLTLTLWYKNRIFNICIRHRKDGKYALGTEKINEQSFDSIEEMVTNYQSEKLVLYSAGERAGKVLLTNSPRRSS